jgi:hypothetical protein
MTGPIGPIQRTDSAGPPARPRPRRWLIVRSAIALSGLYWTGLLCSDLARMTGAPVWLDRLGTALTLPLPLAVTAFAIWGAIRFL